MCSDHEKHRFVEAVIQILMVMTEDNAYSYIQELKQARPGMVTDKEIETWHEVCDTFLRLYGATNRLMEHAEAWGKRTDGNVIGKMTDLHRSMN